MASPLGLGNDILQVVLHKYRYMYSLTDLNFGAGAHHLINSLAPCALTGGLNYGRLLSMLRVVCRDRNSEEDLPVNLSAQSRQQ